MRRVDFTPSTRIKLRNEIVREWVKDGMPREKAEAIASAEVNRLSIFGPGHVETIMAGNTVIQVRIKGDIADE